MFNVLIRLYICFVIYSTEKYISYSCSSISSFLTSSTSNYIFSIQQFMKKSQSSFFCCCRCCYLKIAKLIYFINYIQRINTITGLSNFSILSFIKDSLDSVTLQIKSCSNWVVPIDLPNFFSIKKTNCSKSSAHSWKTNILHYLVIT